MIRCRLRPEEQAEVWRRYRTGESMRSISRTLDRSLKAVRRLISATGGRAPKPRRSSARRLLLAEREEILRRVAAGDSGRCIAGRLGRAPSTISREIARNGGRRRDRASRAEAAARWRARRPKTPQLTHCRGLRRLVEDKLALRWSPQQIARWLPGAHPEEPEWRVSHETIYLSLFVQPRGTLRKQLTRYLRTRGTVGRPRAPDARGQGQLRDAVDISAPRPSWPIGRCRALGGDLLLGRRNSGIATSWHNPTRARAESCRDHRREHLPIVRSAAKRRSRLARWVPSSPTRATAAGGTAWSACFGHSRGVSGLRGYGRLRINVTEVLRQTRRGQRSRAAS